MDIYIVGAGTFAEKLTATFLSHGLDVNAFIDEFRSEPFINRPVFKANQLINVDSQDLFIITISHPEYAHNAKQRLLKQHVCSDKIIVLYYDSCAMLFEAMLSESVEKTKRCLVSCRGDFLTLESLFYGEQQLDKAKSQISFRMLGRGGNYYSHFANLPKLLAADNSINFYSDESLAPSIKNEMLSQHRMLETEAELVISAQLFPCSPAKTPKLTLTHAIYDSVMFRDTIIETLAQPNNHYIAIPSKASFEQHKKICIENKLTNNVVLIPIGYPKFDVNLRKYQHRSKAFTPDSVLYAPTQSATRKPNSNSGYSIDHAMKCLKLLSNNNPELNIIFRPHPDDLKLVQSGIQSSNIKVLASLITFIENLPKGEIDRKNSPIDSYCRAKFMISDTSSTAFTFAFSTLKPVIFYSPDEEELPKSWLESCFFKDREEIGVIAKTPLELECCVKKINNKFEIKSYHERIYLLRKLQLFNIGCAESKLINVISSIKKGEKLIGCWSLNEYKNVNQ